MLPRLLPSTQCGIRHSGEEILHENPAGKLIFNDKRFHGHYSFLLHRTVSTDSFRLIAFSFDRFLEQTGKFNCAPRLTYAPPRTGRPLLTYRPVAAGHNITGCCRSRQWSAAARHAGAVIRNPAAEGAQCGAALSSCWQPSPCGIAAAIGGCGGLFDQPPQDYPSLSREQRSASALAHGEPDTEVTVSELS